MQKIIIFIYGILAYVIFLIAFLYAIGFVGNFLVPKGIDAGEALSFSYSLIINLVLLSLFAIQHSVMARPAFKKWWTALIGEAAERSTYVLFSSLALLLLYWQWQPMTAVVWEIEHAVLSKILLGIFALGWIIVFLATFMINHFELFGLLQIFNNLKNKTAAPSKFQINFFYTLVRHPIMLGFLIAFWATPYMTVGHLLFATVTTIYILIAVKYLEEKDLRNALGERYAQYQKEVPMLIPFTKKRP